MDIVEQTVKSGVAPLELVYQQVISTRSERRAAFRAQLRINSLELGTLMPMQYQEISLKNIQSERLAAWVIEKLTEEIDKIDIASIQYDWISFYAPVRMLYRNKLYNKLSRLVKNGKIKDSSKIALEFTEVLVLPFSILATTLVVVLTTCNRRPDAGEPVPMPTLPA